MEVWKGTRGRSRGLKSMNYMIAFNLRTARWELFAKGMHVSNHPNFQTALRALNDYYHRYQETSDTAKKTGGRHVPGPWYVEVKDDVTSVESELYTITSDIGNDNADLVAASPDLYEAAKRALTDIRELNGTMQELKLQKTLELLEAAISKAEGKYE